MSSLLVVVVKSHLFQKFVLLKREIGTSRDHWEMANLRLSIAGGRARYLGATWGGGSRVNRDGWKIHRKQGGGGSYSQLYLTNRYLVEAPG